MAKKFSIFEFLTKMSRLDIINNFFLKLNQDQISILDNNLIFFNHQTIIFNIFYQFLRIQNNSLGKKEEYQLILLTFPDINQNNFLYESSFFFFLPKNTVSYSELGYLLTFDNDDNCYIHYFPFGNLDFISLYWFDEKSYQKNNLVLKSQFRKVSNSKIFWKILIESVNDKLKYLPIKYISKKSLMKLLNSFSKSSKNIELPPELKLIILDYLENDYFRFIIS